MFHTFVVQPIYNAFILLLDIMPGADVGPAIIALTLLIRFIFYPLFMSSLRTQMAMQAVQPELNRINEKHKDDASVRAQETAALFLKHRIKPFSLIFSTIIQLVIFIGLSYVFFRLAPPTIHSELLYSFVRTPGVVGTHFLGFLDVTARNNFILALLVGATQYYAIKLSLDRTGKPAPDATPEKIAAQKMQRNMMIVMLPVMGAVFTYTFPAGVGIYMVVTSLVSVAQEMIIKQRPL